MAQRTFRYRPFWRSLSQSAPFFQRTLDMATAQDEIKKKFLSSPFFAVVGASRDQSKFGTKILKWYQARMLNVTPVHPKESELEGIATVSALRELPFPSTTSVSIVTPAKVTLKVLKEAKELNVPALWLQPGAEDEDVATFIEENELADRVIYGGPCLLVEGESVRRSLL